MTSLAKKVYEIFLNILFPPLCIHCRTYLKKLEEKENFLCDTCFGGIKIYNTIFYINPHFTLASASSYKNDAIKTTIHYFKYENFLDLKKPIEKIIASYIDKIGFIENEWKNTIVVPIPLHKTRLRKRDFNQAEAIAKIISGKLDIPLQSNVLTRKKNTKQQIKLKSDKERRENLRDAFVLAPGVKKKLKNSTIILVDDVYTSGVTMHEATKILRRGGVKNVIGFVVAKAN